jgi:HAD superfamily hydrolase (TIGR01484 family)
MTQSYLNITRKLAREIRLIVADVDGTLVSSGDSVSPTVAETIKSLEHYGIMAGFASGRTLPRLEPLAMALKISGPIIAENGSVAKLKRDSELFNLGYSLQPLL